VKILISGAGAVGCILGAALLRNGHEAVFLARGTNREALQNRGLQVQWPEEAWNLASLRVLGPESPAEEFDAILFCVKGYDWEAAAEPLLRFSAPWILTFQNGVLVHRELRSRVGAAVSGAVIYVAADRPEPGRVVSKGLARVVLDSARPAAEITRPLSEALATPTVKVQLSENIELDLWRKYLFLCSFSAINTLTERPASAILGDPETRNVWAAMMREIVALGRASGIGLAESDVETALANAAKFPPGTSSSLLADTLRKQNTEVDLLQGHLVREAERLGVQAPISRIIHALLRLKTRKD
jgi:2-dehydropantoate 2-reductase